MSIVDLSNKKINKKQNTTFILSTRDQTIQKISDHVILLKDGLIIFEERNGVPY